MTIFDVVGGSADALAEYITARESGTISATIKQFAPSIKDEEIWKSLRETHKERYEMLLKQLKSEVEK